MRRVSVVLTVMACGVAAGWLGYWLGHLAGWSEGADWPRSIGGGRGAITLSVVLALAGVLLAIGWLTILPEVRARRLLEFGLEARARVASTTRTGAEFGGLVDRRRQLSVELWVHPLTEPPFRASATVIATEEEEQSLVPGAEVSVRYDPASHRVAVQRRYVVFAP